MRQTRGRKLPVENSQVQVLFQVAFFVTVIVVLYRQGSLRIGERLVDVTKFRTVGRIYIDAGACQIRLIKIGTGHRID